MLSSSAKQNGRWSRFDVGRREWRRCGGRRVFPQIAARQRFAGARLGARRHQCRRLFELERICSCDASHRSPHKGEFHRVFASLVFMFDCGFRAACRCLRAFLRPYDRAPRRRATLRKSAVMAASRIRAPRRRSAATTAPSRTRCPRRRRRSPQRRARRTSKYRALARSPAARRSTRSPTQRVCKAKATIKIPIIEREPARWAIQLETPKA